MLNKAINLNAFIQSKKIEEDEINKHKKDFFKRGGKITTLKPSGMPVNHLKPCRTPYTNQIEVHV